MTEIKIILIAAIFHLSLWCSGQQILPDEFIKGDSELKKGNYKKAIKYFDRVIKTKPEFEWALLLRSQANYNLKNYQSTIEDCEKILAISPNIKSPHDLTALWNLGVAYNSLREFTLARKYLDQAKQIDPTNIKLYEHIGYSYLEEHQFDSAINEFEAMLKIDDQSSKAYYGIGKAKFFQKDYEGSIKAFDSAITINESYGIAYQNRGSAKLEIGDLVGCCQDWNKCLSLGVDEIKPFLKQICN